MRLSQEQGAALLAWARARLAQELGGPPAARPEAPWAQATAATFVTLRWRDSGALQGCIGSLEPVRALADDVAHNAVAAALDDPRGAPLSQSDLDQLELELSILSPLEPVPCSDEASALAALRPGTDGVVFAAGRRRATLLPDVWERLRTPERFLSALRDKAGFGPRWSDDVRLWRYTTDQHWDPPREERP